MSRWAVAGENTIKLTGNRLLGYRRSIAVLISSSDYSPADRRKVIKVCPNLGISISATVLRTRHTDTYPRGNTNVNFEKYKCRVERRCITQNRQNVYL